MICVRAKTPERRIYVVIATDRGCPTLRLSGREKMGTVSNAADTSSKESMSLNGARIVNFDEQAGCPGEVANHNLENTKHSHGTIRQAAARFTKWSGG